MIPSTRASLMLMAAVSLFASGLASQTYTRTQTTGAYVERTGTPAAATLVGNFNDGAFSFALPFDFAYFDRTYRHCFLNTNGQVTFTTANVASLDVANLTAVVASPTLRESINVLRSDLAGNDLTANFGIFVESGRVVFQWRRVGSATNAGAYHMNFQCHLLSNGTIELRYGPEIIAVDQDLSYVSGIVNASGAASFAGFNNLLTVQTARPAAGQIVTFVPAGFTQSDGVDLAGRVNASPAAGFYGGDTQDHVIANFRLAPRGAGATVTQIRVRHMAVNIADTMSLTLYRDGGLLGALDAPDVPLGGGAQSMSGAATTTFSISELVTTQAISYLLVLNVGATTTFYERDVNAYHFHILPTSADITSTAAVWGGYYSEIHQSSPGPVVRAAVSREAARMNLARANTGNVPLVSFDLRTVSGFGNTTCSEMAFSVALTGLAISDIAEFRLYRDDGSLTGGVDPNDTQIGGTLANPTSTSFSFNVSEYLSSSGVNFLLTLRLGAAYAGNGQITGSLAFAGLDFLVTDTVVAPSTAADGYPLLTTGTGASVILRPRLDGKLTSLPVAATSTNNAAVCFFLQTSTGTSNLSGLVFRGDTTGISAARLLEDTGTSRGRFDAGDIQLGLPGTIVSAAAGTITFGFAPSLALPPSGRNLLLVVDFTGAAAAVTHTMSLAPADVAATVAVAGVTVTGTAMTVQAGSANGVDITAVGFVGSVSFGGNQIGLVARVLMTARGTGGDAPALEFEVTDAAGGVGRLSGLRTLVFIEGAGPLGVLDSTDMLLNHYDRDPLDHTTPLTLLSSGSPASVTGVRSILICVRREGLPVDGIAGIAFRGFVGGTDVQIGTLPGALVSQIAVFNNAVDSSGGDDEYADDGPRCSASETGSPWLMLGAIMALLLLTPRFGRARA